MVVRPGFWQGTVAAIVPTDDALIVVQRARRGISPSRPDRVGKDSTANNARMNTMLAIELNIPPIDETLLRVVAIDSPTCRPPHRVGVKDHPIVTSGDTSRPWVDAHRHPLVGNVELVSWDLITVGQLVSIVHRTPNLDLTRRRSSRIPLGQPL